MALKLISQANQLQPKVPSTFGETPGGTLLRNVVRTGERVAELPFLVPEAANVLARQFTTPVPGQKAPEGYKPVELGLPTRQVVREKLGQQLPESYLQPQSTAEEILDTTIQNTPLVYLLGGGPLWANIAKDVAGTTAMKGAEKLGGGPISQVFAGLLGGKVFSKVSGFRGLKNFFQQGGTPNTLANIADQAKTKFYTNADKLGAKININGASYKDNLTKLSDKINKTSALSTTEKNELTDKIRLYLEDIGEKDLVNASKILDRKKEINALWPSYLGGKNKVAREYLENIQKTMFEELENIGKSNRSFNKAWRSGDDIVKAQNYKNYLQEIIEDYPKVSKIITNPLAQQALGLGAGSFLGGIGGAALGAGLAKGFQKGNQLYGFIGSPATQKLLNQSFIYTINRNTPELAKTWAKLNKNAEQYENKNKIEVGPETSSGNLRLISRSI